MAGIVARRIRRLLFVCLFSSHTVSALADAEFPRLLEELLHPLQLVLHQFQHFGLVVRLQRYQPSLDVSDLVRHYFSESL